MGMSAGKIQALKLMRDQKILQRWLIIDLKRIMIYITYQEKEMKTKSYHLLLSPQCFSKPRAKEDINNGCNACDS
jgi:hypothetical protein